MCLHFNVLAQDDLRREAWVYRTEKNGNFVDCLKVVIRYDPEKTYMCKDIYTYYQMTVIVPGYNYCKNLDDFATNQSVEFAFCMTDLYRGVATIGLHSFLYYGKYKGIGLISARNILPPPSHAYAGIILPIQVPYQSIIAFGNMESHSQPNSLASTSYHVDPKHHDRLLKTPYSELSFDMFLPGALLKD